MKIAKGCFFNQFGRNHFGEIAFEQLDDNPQSKKSASTLKVGLAQCRLEMHSGNQRCLKTSVVEIAGSVCIISRIWSRKLICPEKSGPWLTDCLCIEYIYNLIRLSKFNLTFLNMALFQGGLLCTETPPPPPDTQPSLPLSLSPPLPSKKNNK